jgi:hypothetical protein
MPGEVFDAPNQQAVRADGSGPGIDEGASVEGDAPSSPGTYDPGADTIDAVKAYVEAHPDETDEVYEAELAGKARTTLLDWFAE